MTITVKRIGLFCWSWDLSWPVAPGSWLKVGVGDVSMTRRGAERAARRAAVRESRRRRWADEATVVVIPPDGGLS